MVRIHLFCALQVISVKKLQLISRLHIMEQSWFKTAEHCSLNIALKVTMHFLFLNTWYMAHAKNT